MNFSDNTGMLIKAIRFAAGKHRNQRRKDSLKSPYINHPIEVLQLLWEVGQVRDSQVLLGAVLHDTVEDTNTSAGEISEIFGPEVAEYVLEVTDDKSLPKNKRKQKQIEVAGHKSHGAKLISLADKSCNLRNLNDIPPQHWNRKRRSEYLLWSERVVAGLRGTSDALEEYYDQQLIRGKKILDIG